MALRRALTGTPGALRFLSRLPVPQTPFEPPLDAPPEIERIGPGFPLAALLIGLTGALTALTAHAIGLSPWLSSTLAVAVLMGVTGALHEDGLADMADGLGGMNIARRLEIMKDSRIGTFGVLALILGFALRVGALQELMAIDVCASVAALVAAGTLARAAALGVLGVLPPARPGGLAHGIGRPSPATLATAAGLALVIAALLVIPGFGTLAYIGGLIVGILAFFALTRLARAQFGGQTGDVAGAAALMVEIAFLLGLLIFARHP
ncbi:adenosylcobinamide-GDP ribazoletransferase [Ancylobacter sp. VKM B-3255]|uniref:Adenosylcobinamide-GDP ribazoletransferase n=2 Tax=Ancylobacter radicis TaxID=2836179 RepID=A0ABS5R903_9HYPH|nr:adenosylcobinamide-GDP ribazoletransferase [Ancylobacter radicis]